MYITPKEAQKKYGYHPKTLANWADDGKIQFTKSPGGHRRYAVASLEAVASDPTKEIICYVRVSTRSQKDDLQNQLDYVSSHYPQAECITDYGSGLNFKRKRFLKLMERVSRREVATIVVAHKDRLCRFGFDFVEWFCQLNGCQIKVLNNTYKPPHQELMEDFMAIMHCFSSKLYFLRRYEKEIRNESEKAEQCDIICLSTEEGRTDGAQAEEGI
jgi:predicted site-specific integrase-resolvase